FPPDEAREGGRHVATQGVTWFGGGMLGVTGRPRCPLKGEPLRRRKSEHFGEPPDRVALRSPSLPALQQTDRDRREAGPLRQLLLRQPHPVPVPPQEIPEFRHLRPVRS